MTNEIIPTPKELLDVSKIFLAYLANHGDVLATAQTANVEIADVLYLAKVELWDLKMEKQGIPRGSVSKETKARALDLNRMANYIQALRLRGTVDKILQFIYEDPANIQRFCTEIDKRGIPIPTTKPVLDLVKAAEVCHALTYRALGDVVEKLEGGGDLDTRNIKALHLTMIQHFGDKGPVDLKVAEPILQAASAKTVDPQTAARYLDDDLPVHTTPPA